MMILNKSINDSSLRKKYQWTVNLWKNSTKHSKNKEYPVHIKCCRANLEKDRKLVNSFYEASIILIPELDKYNPRKLNYKPISPLNRCAKVPTTILAIY